MSEQERPLRRRTPEPGRRARLVVEYTDQEWAKVRQLAAEAGWSPGAWVAQRALDPGDAAVQSGMPPNQMHGAALLQLMTTQRQLRGIGTNLNQIAKAVNSVLAQHGDSHDAGELLALLAAVVAPLPALVDDARDTRVRADKAVVEVMTTRTRSQRRQ